MRKDCHSCNAEVAVCLCLYMKESNIRAHKVIIQQLEMAVHEGGKFPFGQCNAATM